MNTIKTRTSSDVLGHYSGKGMHSVVYKSLVDPLAPMFNKGITWDELQARSQDQKDIFNFEESLYYEYKKFLVGFTRDLRAVNKRITEFKKMKVFNPDGSQALAVIGAVEQLLLVDELYELIPKHNQAKAKIIALLKKF